MDAHLETSSMNARELPVRPSLDQYEQLAGDLFNAYESGDSEALRRLRDHYQLVKGSAK